MKVTSLRMQKFRSFDDSGWVDLTAMNVFIGANNSGKSSILRGLHQLQVGIENEFGDVRVGSTVSTVEINLDSVPESKGWGNVAPNELFRYVAEITSNDRRGGSWNGAVYDHRNQRVAAGAIRLLNVEPDNFLVPYWSKRKSASYNEDVREQFVRDVAPDVRNLAAKLSRLANPEFPKHDVYAKACRSILGFVVTAIPAPNGQRPGIYLPDGSTIPIEQMGEGVPNIVHMLVNLATATGKLFLVEEPENDLHPAALKLLLDLMLASSASNQFVVSTHSNIVVRYLGGIQGSRLFRVSSPPGVLPIKSEIEVVPELPDARIAVLRDLGYAFSDFDLWDGWLFLEESSAERIIRDYLIPWFVPKLSRLRCVSSSGVDRVAPLLDDFMRVVVFTHLQPAYRGKTWVRVDCDAAGQGVIRALKTKFTDWADDRIRALSFEDFELYYPSAFAERVNNVLTIPDKGLRRDAKRDLLQEVISWLDADHQRGKDALQASAGVLIRDLESIAGQV